MFSPVCLTLNGATSITVISRFHTPTGPGVFWGNLSNRPSLRHLGVIWKRDFFSEARSFQKAVNRNYWRIFTALQKRGHNPLTISYKNRFIAKSNTEEWNGMKIMSEWLSKKASTVMQHYWVLVLSMCASLKFGVFAPAKCLFDCNQAMLLVLISAVGTVSAAPNTLSPAISKQCYESFYRLCCFLISCLLPLWLINSSIEYLSVHLLAALNSIAVWQLLWTCRTLICFHLECGASHTHQVHLSHVELGTAQSLPALPPKGAELHRHLRCRHSGEHFMQNGQYLWRRIDGSRL